MFEYIKGTLAGRTAAYAIVEVSGVAFKIFTGGRSLQNAVSVGDAVTFYTYLHVREDIFDLYGFITAEERKTFEMLLSVSGVGPKAAINILSSATAEELAIAIATNDTKTITAAQGVGPKLAQRIILELRDKVKAEYLIKGGASEIMPRTSLESEAVEALIALGYPPAPAARAVKSAGDGLTLEETIKRALKNLL